MKLSEQIRRQAYVGGAAGMLLCNGWADDVALLEETIAGLDRQCTELGESLAQHDAAGDQLLRRFVAVLPRLTPADLKAARRMRAPLDGKEKP